MQYRIGDRDPVTGLYDVIHPDGSATRNGIKIFNSAHEFGDVVLATVRSDGMLILDGVKATLAEVVNNSLTLSGFAEKPVGYLDGQVFNNEEDVILPTVSVKFAPGSPEELAPGAGSFVVRIEIDRPQRRDLRVKLEFAGTSIAADYTTVGLAADSPAVPIVIIPAGASFVDITITPASSVTSTKTIVATVMQLRDYRIAQDKSVTATIATESLLVIEFRPLQPYSPSVPSQYRMVPTFPGFYLFGSQTIINAFTILIENTLPYALNEIGSNNFIESYTQPPNVTYTYTPVDPSEPFYVNSDQGIQSVEITLPPVSTYRYLYFVSKHDGSAFNPLVLFDDSSHGTISASIRSSVPSAVVYPYPSDAGEKLGWVDWRWSDKFESNPGSTSNRRDYVTGFGLRIDTLNQSNITFLPVRSGVLLEDWISSYPSGTNTYRDLIVNV